MNGQVESLETLLPKLNAAKTDLDAREEEEKAANRRTTDARNVYNGICKSMDAAVAKLKEQAPWNTDWHAAVHGRGGPA